MIDDMLLKLKNRRLVAALVPLIGGLFIGWTFVVKPGLSNIAAASAEIGGLSQKQVSFGHIKDSEMKLEEHRRMISKAEDRAKLIDELNLLAEKSNLSILSITPEEKRAVPGGFLERVSVRIEAEGNYHQLGGFVSRIESHSQFIKVTALDIDSLSLGLDAGKEKKGVYGMMISVSFYNLIPGAL